MNDILFALLSCSVAILDVPESNRNAAHFLCTNKNGDPGRSPLLHLDNVILRAGIKILFYQ